MVQKGNIEILFSWELAILISQCQITWKDDQDPSDERIDTGYFAKEQHTEKYRTDRFKVAEDCSPVCSDILETFEI